MKILVIASSAHKNGTSSFLADKFIEGAKSVGHEVFRFDCAFKNIHPCIGCDSCHKNKKCVFDDDMSELNPHLLKSDAIVFVSPIYYYDLNAQIKAVIDRFYANDDKIHANKKSVLMLTMADSTYDSADGAIQTFKGMTRYLNWEISGIVVAKDCPTLDKLKSSDFPEKAFDLGKRL